MSGKDGTGPAPTQSAAWVDADSSPGEVRIGGARLVRGGATVSAFTQETRASDDPPEASGRVLSDSEIAEGGLLTERVIEFGEMREEPVISKQAVVREELVVRKDVKKRTERIADTVRRTEVDVERLRPSAEGAENGDSTAR